MSTLFITATDTGAGKTTITTALLAGLRAQGVDAVGYKPVASGCEWTAEGWRNDDALALRAAAPTPLPYARSNPYAFAPAIAPHLAAAQAGVVIDPTVLAEAHAALAARHARVLAEGAGGWLTPLSGDLLLGDWVAAQHWPVLLVVGMRLGCLNHALLTAAAIRQHTRLVGWVANVGAEAMPELEANIATLSHHLGPPLWQHGPHGQLPPQALAALFPH